MKILNSTEYVVCLQKEDTILEFGIGETKELDPQNAKGIWVAKFFTGTAPKTEETWMLQASFFREFGCAVLRLLRQEDAL